MEVAVAEIDKSISQWANRARKSTRYICPVFASVGPRPLYSVVPTLVFQVELDSFMFRTNNTARVLSILGDGDGWENI